MMSTLLRPNMLTTQEKGDSQIGSLEINSRQDLGLLKQPTSPTNIVIDREAGGNSTKLRVDSPN